MAGESLGAYGWEYDRKGMYARIEMKRRKTGVQGR